MVEKFDLVVVGSGPAGYTAAMLAVDMNKKVCLIEKQALGGAGIINGALTSKTLWHLSEYYSTANRSDLGYKAASVSVDFAEVIKSVRNAAKSKIYQLKSQIETYAQGKFPDKSLTYLHGTASFVDEHTLEVCTKVGCRRVFGNYILLATGSQPRTISTIPIDHKRIITSDDILRLEKFPERLMVIGSGIIGTEYATIFSNFGKTQVHLLDRQNRVIPFEDDDVSDFISNNLQQNGVIIHHQAQLRTIEPTDDALDVILDFTDGHSQVIEVDMALIAIGRKPNIEDLQLQNIGLDISKINFLTTDENLILLNEKGYKHIYAAGDATGSTQLYSVAEAQGRYAVNHMFGEKPSKVNYFNMPTLMFFKPEVAAVGLNEKKLQEQKVAYKSIFYSNSLINRAISMSETNGFIKLLISNDGQNRILGMRAAGPQASAMIVAIAHLLNQTNGIQQVLETVYPHPSIPEGIKDCLLVLQGNSIYKPFVFPNEIRIKVWDGQ